MRALEEWVPSLGQVLQYLSYRYHLCSLIIDCYFTKLNVDYTYPESSTKAYDQLWNKYTIFKYQRQVGFEKDYQSR